MEDDEDPRKLAYMLDFYPDMIWVLEAGRPLDHPDINCLNRGEGHTICPDMIPKGCGRPLCHPDMDCVDQWLVGG